MDNENKSKYESTIKWAIEHYPFDKISNIFDITQNISELKLPEEELEKVFDEYLIKIMSLKKERNIWNILKMSMKELKK